MDEDTRGQYTHRYFVHIQRHPRGSLFDSRLTSPTLSLTFGYRRIPSRSSDHLPQRSIAYNRPLSLAFCSFHVVACTHISHRCFRLSSSPLVHSPFSELPSLAYHFLNLRAGLDMPSILHFDQQYFVLVFPFLFDP